MFVFAQGVPTGMASKRTNNDMNKHQPGINEKPVRHHAKGMRNIVVRHYAILDAHLVKKDSGNQVTQGLVRNSTPKSAGISSCAHEW